MRRHVKISLFGAAMNSGNFGVSALAHAVLSELFLRIPDVRITVFDFGRGRRQERVRIDDEDRFYTAVGSVLSSRIYRQDNLWNMRISGLLGGLKNCGIEEIKSSDCALDITGGDSFTDLYGARRFRAGILRKRIILQQGTPLILLPQTYGPFRSEYAKHAAHSVIEKAAMVWTRDRQSIDVIRSLFPDGELPVTCRQGVDVAFLLAAVPPRGEAARSANELLGRATGPRIGINVSGLLYRRHDEQRKYGLASDYRDLITSLVHEIIAATDCHIYFIPHVLGSRENEESDVPACRALVESLPEKAQNRVTLMDVPLDQNETKWFISRMEWFCGTRMHSTIAALSSFIPTIALDYSGKAIGVFETCGQGDSVVDLGTKGTEAAVDISLTSLIGRAERSEVMREAVTGTIRNARAQMDYIVSYCENRTHAVNKHQIKIL